MDTTDYRTTPEITDRPYRAWIIARGADPAFIATGTNIEYRKLLRQRYEVEVMESSTTATAEQIAERMISREYRCPVCRVGTLKPGDDLCAACVETADEYAAEWADIVSGRDMHNTCLSCYGDAHNNALCFDCTTWPRACAVRGCERHALKDDTYCRKCRDYEDAVIEMAEGKLAAREARKARFDRFAAYPFTHEAQVTRAFGWIIGVLVVLGIVAQVGMARGWWGR